jgi:hypothetical protein
VAIRNKNGKQGHQQYSKFQGQGTEDTSEIVFKFECYCESEALETFRMPGLRLGQPTSIGETVSQVAKEPST